MDRKDQYKRKTETTEELRARRRRENIELRKERRSRLRNSKRIRVSECYDEETEEEFTVEQVNGLTEELIKKTGDRRDVLRKLRKAFIQGSLLADAFLSAENGLCSLVGILTGSDAVLQLDAAWCFTNLAAGTYHHAMAVLKEAGPYLITYLDSSNHQLQDQCAWALGNIAGDCVESRDTLLAQGVLPPLHKMLQSTMPDVVRSAAFALSNLVRGEHADTKKLVDLGMLQDLSRHLVYDEENLDMISEVTWVLVYIAASGKHESELTSAGVLKSLPALLVAIAKDSPTNFEVLTPALRCLGNLCSGPEDITSQVLQTEGIIAAMATFLHSQHHNIQKECLWALSNMTSHLGACEQVLSEGLVPHIIQMVSTTFDIKTEAAYCLCNLGSQGASMCQQLVGMGAMKGMAPLLKSSDTDTVKLALSFTEMVLRTTPNGVTEFEESGGLEGLEVLEYHSNDTLRSQTGELLEKYFYKEEGADDRHAKESESGAKLEGSPMEV